jgi:hypothetical protein
MKRARKITFKRFMILCESIGLFDMIIHDKIKETDNFNNECEIIDNPILTEEIKKLKMSIREFEEKTNLTLDIDLFEYGKETLDY